MTKNEAQTKKLLALQDYYFQHKQLLEDLERKLGIEEGDQDPISICLQIEDKENHGTSSRRN